MQEPSGTSIQLVSHHKGEVKVSKTQSSSPSHPTFPWSGAGPLGCGINPALQTIDVIPSTIFHYLHAYFLQPYRYKNYTRLVTNAHMCEQLAQNRCWAAHLRKSNLQLLDWHCKTEALIIRPPTRSIVQLCNGSFPRHSYVHWMGPTTSSLAYLWSCSQ